AGRCGRGRWDRGRCPAWRPRASGTPVGRRASRAAPTEHAPGGAGEGERDARARGDVEMLCATGVRGAEEEPERLARGERADGERQGGGDGGRGRRGVAAGERRRRETRAARLPDERRDDA